MNVAAARTFLTVVELGTLKRAAERLNVTQSTVTMRLNKLEERLGQVLLVRSKAGTELTAAGFKFLRYAEMLVQIWDQARTEVSLPADVEGLCNLGCHLDLWEGAGRLWLDLLRRDHPRVAVEVWNGTNEELNGWLGSGLIDMALLFDPRSGDDRRVSALFEDRLVQVASAARALQRWDPAYVYVDHGTAFRRQHAIAYPVEETAAVTFGNSPWALEHILQYGGSGYLPERLVREYLDAGRLFAVEGATVFTRTAYLAIGPSRTAAWPWFERAIATLDAELASHGTTAPAKA